MATNTAGSVARNDYTQSIDYLRVKFTVADVAAGATTKTVGVLPAGATILSPISGVDVLTVFNAATNNRLNIGITGTTAKYASNSSLLTAGFVAMAVAVGHTVTVDTPIIATLDVTGGSQTTGDCTVVIAYVKANDNLYI
jgi:hypothetical protein